MNARCEQFLDALQESNWFSQVGLPIPCAPVLRLGDLAIPAFRIQLASSWEEMKKLITSQEWEDLSIDQRNRVSTGVVTACPQRFNQWNPTASEAHGRVVRIFQEKAGAIVESQRMPKRFTDMVQWAICLVCLELEFADIVAPGFYSIQGYWYLAGHLPCGWVGPPETGAMVVF
jgi:hypothetical protein